MNKNKRGAPDGNKNTLGKHWKVKDTTKMRGRHPKSEFKKDSTPWNKGTKGLQFAWNKHKKMGDETKKKISIALKGRVAWNKGLPSTFTKEEMKTRGLRGLLKQQHSKKPTSIEIKVYEELKNRGVVFETQKLINGKFIVDAYIPSLNLVIEADGDYWHSLDRVVKKDRAENAYLIKCGYKMLRLSEKEINSGSFIERLVN